MSSRPWPLRHLRTAGSALAAAGLAAAVSAPLLTGSVAGAATTASPGLTAGTTLSGVVIRGGTAAADAFSTWRGKPVDVVVDYTGTSTWASITGVAQQGLTNYWAGNSAHRVWSVPLIPSSRSENASLKVGATGAYNDKYATVAKALVAGGDGNATLRLGWEMTGDWFAWSGVTDPASYAATFRQAVTAMRSVPGAHFTFDWNPSTGFADPEPMYPGDAYVDIISTDIYDTSWAWSYAPSDHARVWDHYLTMQYGLNWLSSFADEHHKPMAIPEWGLAWRCDGHGGGDDPYWVQQMRNWIDTHDVAYEAYFQHQDSDCAKFSMASGRFPAAAEEYQRLFSATTAPTVPTLSTPLTQLPAVDVVPVANPTPSPLVDVEPVDTATPSPVVVSTPSSPAPKASPSSSGDSLDQQRIRASAVADRTGSWALNGSTLSTNSYLFLADDPAVTKVDFWLDVPRGAAATHTELWGPWDLMGGSASAASPLVLSALEPGQHTLTVSATYRDGSVRTNTAGFAVAAATGAPAVSSAGAPSSDVLDVHHVRASAQASRDGSWTLQGSRLGTDSYLFVTDEPGMVKVDFWLDAPRGAAATHTESWGPWDLVGGSTRAADPLLLRSLVADTHTLSVAATYRDGSVRRATVTFDSAPRG